MTAALPARALLLAMLGACSMPGQAQDKLPVFLNVKAEDGVGQRVAYELRELLRRSPVMAITAAPGQAWLRFNFVSVPTGDASTAYSVVVVLADNGAYSGASYWTNVVGFCGANVTEGCAKNLLAHFDQAVTDFRAEEARRQAQQQAAAPARPDKKR